LLNIELETTSSAPHIHIAGLGSSFRREVYGRVSASYPTEAGVPMRDGKRLAVLVGQRKAQAIAVKRVRARRRWSKLRERLHGL
jgi:hypothetical protein